MLKHHLKMVVTFLLATGLTACGGGGGGSLPSTLNAVPASLGAAHPIVARTAAVQTQNAASYTAIDVGGPANGNWLADTGFSAGSWTSSTTHAIDVSNVTSAAPQAVYQSQRAQSTLAYTIPNLTANAAYTIRLHFAETFFGSAGQRVFGVSINGASVLANFDIFAAAGGENIAIVKQFSSKADATGKISIVLAATVNNATLSGIEVSAGSSVSTPSPVATPTPSVAPGIAINAGGGATGSWVGDVDYNGGTTYTSYSPVVTSGVANAASQAVYQTQRYASDLTYTIPKLTPNAAYAVRLHFAETYFDAAASRVFSVKINNIPVLTNFDIFQTAGGKNIAVVKTFSSSADASGTITIALTASVNNATLAGIEIIPGSVAVAQPSPTPVATPTPVASPAPSPIASAGGKYPIYSSYFTGNTPFHHTVSQLMAAGGTVLSSTIAAHYWSEGVGNSQPANQSGGVGPLYMVQAGDPGYVFSCPTWGACNASGMVAHYPGGAYPQTGTDHHLNSFDPIYLHGEIDGWGGDGNPNHACNLTAGNPGTATCSWGGFYPFSGTGLAQGGNSGDAGGYAFGLMNITAQELLQGHIDHALGIEESCLDDGGVYPSTIGRTSDAHCPSNLEPNAKYGQLIHLKSSVNVASLGYSQYCRVIVQALQTYGAYTADNNGSWGLALNTEYMNAYVGTNPWYTIIFPSMVAGGDGSGTGTNFRFNTCLQRIPTADIEVIQISSNLPPA